MTRVTNESVGTLGFTQEEQTAINVISRQLQDHLHTTLGPPGSSGYRRIVKATPTARAANQLPSGGYGRTVDFIHSPPRIRLFADLTDPTYNADRQIGGDLAAQSHYELAQTNGLAVAMALLWVENQPLVIFDPAKLAHSLGIYLTQLRNYPGLGQIPQDITYYLIRRDPAFFAQYNQALRRTGLADNDTASRVVQSILPDFPAWKQAYDRPLKIQVEPPANRTLVTTRRIPTGEEISWWTLNWAPRYATNTETVKDGWFGDISSPPKIDPGTGWPLYRNLKHTAVLPWPQRPYNTNSIGLAIEAPTNSSGSYRPEEVAMWTTN